MAHVGQEFALGAAGLHRQIARLLKLDSPLLHADFEIVVRGDKGLVALLYVLQHLVEGLDHPADLVGANLCNAKRVVLFAGDSCRHASEQQQRVRDRTQ